MMNAGLPHHTTVPLMRIAITLWVHTLVLARKDFQEMDEHAKVGTVYIFLNCFAFLGVSFT